MTPRTPLTFTAIAVAFVMLTGCAPEAPAPTETAPVTETTAPAVTPSPSDPAVETPAGVEALPENAKAGDVIDAETAAQLNERSYMGSSVPLGYQMPDGSWVLLAANEPLPENVVEVVQQKVRDAVGDLSWQSNAGKRLYDARMAENAATGRTLIVVHHAPDMNPSWVVHSGPGQPTFATREEAVAAAEQHIAGNPAAYVIIVLE